MPFRFRLLEQKQTTDRFWGNNTKIVNKIKMMLLKMMLINKLIMDKLINDVYRMGETFSRFPPRRWGYIMFCCMIGVFLVLS